MSSWYSDPWTQDDSVLGGLPYTVVPPPKYNINNVKTVWNWNPLILDGLPYTVSPLFEEPVFDNTWNVKIRGFYSYRTLTKITHDEESETCEIP